MTLKEITDSVGIFTDEIFTDADLLKLSHRAIARINTHCSTKFPKYEGTNAQYDFFPEDWQEDLLGNYISYAIKMNDGSRNEAQDYLEEFYRILGLFKDKLAELYRFDAIDGQYLNLEGLGGAYGIDTSGAINQGWFRRSGNAGNY